MPRKIKAVEVDEKLWDLTKGIASIQGQKLPDAIEEALKLYINKNKSNLEGLTNDQR